DAGEDPHGAEARPRPRIEVPLDAGHARLQEVDPGEDQPEAREYRPERARLTACDQPEKGANAEDGKGRGRNPEAQTEDRDHPRRRGSSESCAHVDRDRLGQRDQARADEADDGEDCRGGGLSREREERAGCDCAESAGNEPLERAAQGVARKPFQTFGEVVDAEKEQANPTQELYHDVGVPWPVVAPFSRNSSRARGAAGVIDTSMQRRSAAAILWWISRSPEG